MLNSDLDCRVDKPNDCKVLGMNKWGRGFQTHIKYKDIRSYQNGMQIYRPEDGLRVAQRRDFLSPEFFDSGCDIPFCARKSLCPNGKLSAPTPQENQMFDQMFSSSDFAFRNGGPPQCVGIKGVTANSFLGWAIPEGQDKPLWVLNSEKEGTIGTCPG